MTVKTITCWRCGGMRGWGNCLDVVFGWLAWVECWACHGRGELTVICQWCEEPVETLEPGNVHEECRPMMEGNDG